MRRSKGRNGWLQHGDSTQVSGAAPPRQLIQPWHAMLVEGGGSNLFTRDELAGATFWDHHYKSPLASMPERRLLLAVLLDALATWGDSRRQTCYHSSARIARNEAAEWIFSPSEDPFSFRFICGVLGVDADAAVVALKRRSNPEWENWKEGREETRYATKASGSKTG
jgi:hypothetical protein